jgi:hypothetical protein
MAGAPGFEPGIAGPKPAALPLGYAPSLGARSLATVKEEESERDRGDDDEGDDRDHRQEGDEHGQDRDQQLRDGGDPRELAPRVAGNVPPDEEVEEKEQRRDAERCPRGDDVEQDEHALDDGDPECETQSMPSKPAASTAGAVLDDEGHVSTVPSGHGQPRSPERAHPPLRG